MLNKSALKLDGTLDSGTPLHKSMDGPRERMRALGPGALSASELVAAIIGSGNKEQGVMSLASQLIGTLPEGLPSLDTYSIDDLMSVKGIGVSKACQIMASAELGRRIYTASQKPMDKISCPKDLVTLLMAEMRYKKQELFKVVYLNTKNQVLSIEIISMGTLNASLVHPREVFNPAIRKSAYAVVLVHNHPSGNPEPSPEDIQLTERLKKSGDILGIQVLDHIIIGNGIYCSLKERGMM